MVVITWDNTMSDAQDDRTRYYQADAADRCAEARADKAKQFILRPINGNGCTPKPVLITIALMRNLQKHASCSVILAALTLLFIRNAVASSATWKINPESGDWNNADNWSPGGPPNGANDVATFDFSTTTALLLSANTEINAIVFTSGRE